MGFSPVPICRRNNKNTGNIPFFAVHTVPKHPVPPLKDVVYVVAWLADRPTGY